MIISLLLLQLVAPLLLIGWLALRPLPSFRGTLIQIVATGLFVSALWLVGLWLIPPWWNASLLFVAWALASAAGLWRLRGTRRYPSQRLEFGAMLLLVGLGLYSG